jgi:hypothetical protein
MFRPGAGCFWVAPTLGVIVPAFNEASTISSLLELVLAQSWFSSDARSRR